MDLRHCESGWDHTAAVGGDMAGLRKDEVASRRVEEER